MKKSFKQVQQYLENVPNINQGGCGVAALALYDTALAAGKKPSIAYLYHKWWDCGSRAQNKAFKEGNSKKAVACEHVVVKVGNRYYDAEGAVYLNAAKIFYEIDKDITRDHLVASVKNVDCWNDLFNRKKYLPKIEKFIGKKLLGKK